MVKIEKNDRFQQAIHAMEETNKSLFITGKAGTGKSTLLNHFCQNSGKKPVVLAPTGVAALNVKGQTIHSFFNFYVDVTPQKIRDKKTKPRNPKLYKKLQTIIIDEVSMVRADMLDCIDVFLRLYGPKAMQPFGGVQMIFIGDLYQLPPVVTSQEREIFNTHYATPFFFSAQALADYPLEVIELDKVYRQKDQKFVDLLNRIRNNTVEDADIEKLNSRLIKEDKKPSAHFSISLTTTNLRADEINETHLAALKGKFLSVDAEVKGNFTKEYFPTAPALQFKIGAQVMMLNNDTNKRWVNGSIGVIKAVKTDSNDDEYLVIELQDDNEKVDVYPFTWEVFNFNIEDNEIVSAPVGTFTQYPFRLAWAVTIHKSQGKTFDHITVDIGRGTFVAGQIYVALSRCTSFNGIELRTPISRKNIKTDMRILEFFSGHLGEQTPESVIKKDKIKLIKQTIRDKAHVEIVYLKGNNEKTIRTVQPLSVGNEVYKGQNFIGMKAFCTLRKEERLFSVDRILEIKKA